MNCFDIHFCRYVASKSNGAADFAIAMLVDAIFKGNGDYIQLLCAKVGHAENMRLAVSSLLKIGMA